MEGMVMKIIEIWIIRLKIKQSISPVESSQPHQGNYQ